VTQYNTLYLTARSHTHTTQMKMILPSYYTQIHIYTTIGHTYTHTTHTPHTSDEDELTYIEHASQVVPHAHFIFHNEEKEKKTENVYRGVICGHKRKVTTNTLIQDGVLYVIKPYL